jgi:hypothetical protein
LGNEQAVHAHCRKPTQIDGDQHENGLEDSGRAGHGHWKKGKNLIKYFNNANLIFICILKI